MVKSLEQYLSDLPFATPDEKSPDRELSSAERTFVEKYLGMDTLEAMPRLEPDSREIYFTPPRPAVKVAEPEIRVAQPEIVVASPAFPQPEKAEPARAAAIVKEAPPEPEIVVASPVEKTSVESPKPAEPARVTAPLTIEVAEKPEPQTVLKDSLKEQEAIQVVSFFVAGQLFLLPVAGIQEVLRRMELVRVPQAPDFIAGAINLRGKVTPLVHLSALLTNESHHEYNPDKNFIIICGTENMQIGLIIDKINSMHLVPQKKFIWNAESKLGEAAEFLYAIADLDDKVCGVVAPDTIIKKIASA